MDVFIYYQIQTMLLVKKLQLHQKIILFFISLVSTITDKWNSQLFVNNYLECVDVI